MHHEIAGKIDHTFLKKDATREEIERICSEAIKYHFKGVCVYPEHLFQVVSLLNGQNPIPIAVIDFPNGNGLPIEKKQEAIEAFSLGAKEIDMVIDYQSLKRKDYKKVFDGIFQVVRAVNCPVKAIIETCYLTRDEKIIAAALAQAAGVGFIKTSTGYGTSGAKEEDILLIKETVSFPTKIKASGGIKTLEDATKMLLAGADRLGTSSSVKIITS